MPISTPHVYPLRYTRLARYLSGFFMALLTGCNPQSTEPAFLGTLEWERVELIAEKSEPIAEVLVKEGDTVAAGQVLLRQDASRWQSRLNRNRAEFEEASARYAESVEGPRVERIQEGEARYQGAEQVFKIRQRELQRLEQVLARQFVSQDTVDKARASLDTARAERDAAAATLRELKKGTRPEQVEQALKFKARSQAEMVTAEVDLERLTLRAPVSGRVDSVPLMAGNHPQVGTVLAILLTGSAPYARVYIPETRRTEVKIGQTVWVHFDGMPKALEGVVRSIRADAVFTPFYALTERDRHRLSYIAKIDLKGNDSEQLPVGVPVQVTLLNSDVTP